MKRIISLLIAIPFVNKLGNIVGEETTKRLYSTMDTVLKLIKIGIPPLIAGISYLLLGAFFVTVTIHFFRYANFTTIITDNTVIIKSGLISENKKTIRKNKINTLIIKIVLSFQIRAYPFLMMGAGRDFQII